MISLLNYSFENCKLDFMRMQRERERERDVKRFWMGKIKAQWMQEKKWSQENIN